MKILHQPALHNIGIDGLQLEQNGMTGGSQMMALTRQLAWRECFKSKRIQIRRRTHIHEKVDRSNSSRGPEHGKRILANDPDGTVYLWTVD